MTDFCLGTRATERIAGHMDLLHRMSVRAGMSPRARTQAGPVAWHEAQQRCLGCAFETACRQAFARQVQGCVPTFCANRQFFKEPNA